MHIDEDLLFVMLQRRWCSVPQRNIVISSLLRYHDRVAMVDQVYQDNRDYLRSTRHGSPEMQLTASIKCKDEIDEHEDGKPQGQILIEDEIDFVLHSDRDPGSLLPKGRLTIAGGNQE